MLSLPWEGAQAWIQVTTLYLFPANERERSMLLREVTACGYVFQIVPSLLHGSNYPSQATYVIDLLTR